MKLTHGWFGTSGFRRRHPAQIHATSTGRYISRRGRPATASGETCRCRTFLGRATTWRRLQLHG